MITLRDYQREAVDAVFSYFNRARNNPLVVLPTGSGKSLVLAECIRRAREMHEDTRCLVLCHRKELVVQDAAAVRSLIDTHVGIYSASLGAKEIRSITVAQYQSARVQPELFAGFDLVFVDEAHLVPQEDQGSYRAFLKAVPAAVVGLTATPFRLNGGRLTRGKDRIFSSICYDLPVKRLVDEGYLSPLVAPPMTTTIDTSRAQMRGGEYVASSLDEPARAITRAAIAEAREVAKDRRSWLVFAVSIEHAKLCMAELSDLLFGRVALVTGETSQGERDAVINAFRRQEIRAVVNVDVLTTGFDAPCVDCIVLLRPTQSTGLYVQMLGRGMRRHGGKSDCLLLDYGGNIERHGPIDALRIKREGGGVVERKDCWVCKQCDAENPLRLRECPECGAAKPEQPRAVAHETQASRAAAMGGALEPAWVSVAKVRYWRHEKADRPPSLGVAYLSAMGRTIAREWVCPEHVGFAASKFASWWVARGGQQPVPETVDGAIERTGELRRLEAVELIRDGEWDRVRAVRFAPDREPGEDDVSDDDVPTPEPEPLWGDQGWADDELPF